MSEAREREDPRSPPGVRRGGVEPVRGHEREREREKERSRVRVATGSIDDERRGPARHGVGGWVLLLAIGTAGALAHVAVQFKSVEVAYALGRERKLAGDLEEQRRRLQIEIGMLKDPNRVVAIARDDLHMRPPAAGEIRRLVAGESLSPSPSSSLGSGSTDGAPPDSRASIARSTPAAPQRSTESDAKPMARRRHGRAAHRNGADEDVR